MGYGTVMRGGDSPWGGSLSRVEPALQLGEGAAGRGQPEGPQGHAWARSSGSRSACLELCIRMYKLKMCCCKAR